MKTSHRRSSRAKKANSSSHKPANTKSADNGNSRAPQQAPLSGEALQKRIVEILSRIFRATPERKQIREQTGASEEAIEQALAAPFVLEKLRPVTAAFGREQGIVLLSLFFLAARAQLEAEKKGTAGNTPVKTVADRTVEPAIAWGMLPFAAPAAADQMPNELEEYLFAQFRDILRGKPAQPASLPPPAQALTPAPAPAHEPAAAVEVPA